MKRIIIVFSLLGLIACVPNKKISYLQDPTGRIPNDTLIPSNYPEYRLKPGDHIRVEIRTTDNSVTEIFKSYDENSLTPLVLGEDGNIDLPLVGLLNVNGKTMEETKAIIKDSLEKYIVDPYVIVRFGGIRYIALGEFNTPGSYNVSQSRLTIFEAIANAGDLNNIADRSKITLIRQYPNGQQIHIIDVTDRSLVNSPFYYMVPGDQLYAEPLKLREVRAAFSLISEFGAVVTGLSSVILLFILANK